MAVKASTVSTALQRELDRLAATTGEEQVVADIGPGYTNA